MYHVDRFWEGMIRLIGGNGNPTVYSNSPRNLSRVKFLAQFRAGWV